MAAHRFRLASFNVENLFARALALSGPDWSVGKPTLDAYHELNTLFDQPTYSPADKARMVTLLTDLHLEKDDSGGVGALALLRQVRGRLLSRTAAGLQIVASGRADWIGWLELKVGPINDLAMQHAAMVLKDLKADIQGVVEAENRVNLERFSSQTLQFVGGIPYRHVMVIDGNDDRGIDVGLMTRNGFEILSLRSHVDDADSKGKIFSRDCLEATIRLPTGEEIVVLLNHLKSKGYGTQKDNDDKRLRQARRVAKIYQEVFASGQPNVAVIGDFNDSPSRAPLKPLLQQTDLQDISANPKFTGDAFPGTFKNGNAADKIDYILLSPALRARVVGGGVFRKGVWGGTHGDRWPIYPTITRQLEAASDHAAIYADISM